MIGRCHEQFPKHLLVLFQEYGKTLLHDEWIEQRPAKRDLGIRYDAAVREQLTRWVESPYEDAVDLTGEVTMARVSNPLMTIQLNDGRKIEAAFRPEDEDTYYSLRSNSTRLQNCRLIAEDNLVPMARSESHSSDRCPPFREW